MPVLAAEGVTKRFGVTLALDDVSLDVRAGEINALVGENGSGKSTLCRVLFGDPIIAATGGYEGRISLDGVEVSIGDPQDAHACGIGLVHQESALIGDMSIAENVTLGREPVRGSAPLAPVDRAQARAVADAALSRLGVRLDADGAVSELPLGLRQIAETARETDRFGLRVLVLDEPSAALSASEAEALAVATRRLADSGVGVLFVSHRLPEVLALADRVTVLRDGRIVRTLARGEADQAQVARLMVGSDSGRHIRRARRPSEKVALRIEDLKVAMPGDTLRGITFAVRAGEILGVTAQAGHGRLALANGLLGFYPAAGRVEVNGRPVRLGDPAAMERAGLSVIHEDRRHVGLELDRSIALNIGLPSLLAGRAFVRARRFPGGGFVDTAGMAAAAEDLVERFSIRCTGVGQKVGELSGGNQQKVAIARGVVSGPDALIVAEPTRGIDVSAKDVVLEALASVADDGVAVVVVSGEVAELERVCDRVIVLRHGRMAAEYGAPLDTVAIEMGLLGEAVSWGAA